MVFDDIIADIEANKELSPLVTELFLRGRKLNISLAFISQSYFQLPKSIRLNATYYFIAKSPNKENFNKYHLIIYLTLKPYKDYTETPISFLLNDTTLSSNYDLGRI